MYEKIIDNIIDTSLPIYSNLANAAAVLKDLENINWVGFYLVENNNLFVGPYQGDIACGKIEYGKGVCGTSLKEKRSILVPNVHEFKGHIACSSLSKSELVVPIFKNNEVVALLDIDAPIYNRFTDNDLKEMEEVAKVLTKIF